MIRNFLFAIVGTMVLITACRTESNETLPILGRRTVSLEGDTLYHTIGSYAFVNQDSLEVTPETFDDKIYVADFFFTSCPTICPTMKTQMLRVYKKFQDNPQVAILSHSIDPTHDTVAVLKDYSQRLGIDNSAMWHFVTGSKEEIFRVGQSDYMVTAGEDEAAPGGFIHSGAFLLVDGERHIRGIYDGTKPEEVDKLMVDMATLLHESKTD
ncbi:MAG: SCO family protein [Cyclobacteriaceae bacterium]|nr:SCO family protein [Cyclobacteriaceae bacterium]